MKVIFDDWVLGDPPDIEGRCSWSCICPACKEKYKIPSWYLDDAGEGTCGVKGCENESDNYIDFPFGSTEIIDANLEFTYEEGQYE